MNTYKLHKLIFRIQRIHKKLNTLKKKLPSKKEMAINLRSIERYKQSINDYSTYRYFYNKFNRNEKHDKRISIYCTAPCLLRLKYYKLTQLTYKLPKAYKILRNKYTTYLLRLRNHTYYILQNMIYNKHLTISEYINLIYYYIHSTIKYSKLLNNNGRRILSIKADINLIHHIHIMSSNNIAYYILSFRRHGLLSCVRQEVYLFITKKLSDYINIVKLHLGFTLSNYTYLSTNTIKLKILKQSLKWLSDYKSYKKDLSQRDINTYNKAYLKVNGQYSKLHNTTRTKSNKSIYSINNSKYNRWIFFNCLSLNTFNDIINVTPDLFKIRDSLKLPETKETNSSNIIKQEYTFARLQLYYEIISQHNSFYSIKNKAIYSHRIERMKTAFTKLFSILNQIAFLIITHFNIHKNNEKYRPIHTISFNDLSKSYFINSINLFNHTYALIGLSQISKNIQKELNISENYTQRIKLTNKRKTSAIRIIRNCIEHQCLKVLKVTNNNNSISKNVITFYHKSKIVIIRERDLQKITLRLMQICREAIILFSIAMRYKRITLNITHFRKNSYDKYIFKNFSNSLLYYEFTLKNNI